MHAAALARAAVLILGLTPDAVGSRVRTLPLRPWASTHPFLPMKRDLPMRFCFTTPSSMEFRPTLVMSVLPPPLATTTRERREVLQDGQGHIGVTMLIRLRPAWSLPRAEMPPLTLTSGTGPARGRQRRSSGQWLPWG
jgi:hypothetical protein